MQPMPASQELTVPVNCGEESGLHVSPIAVRLSSHELLGLRRWQSLNDQDSSMRKRRLELLSKLLLDLFGLAAFDMRRRLKMTRLRERTARREPAPPSSRCRRAHSGDAGQRQRGNWIAYVPSSG